MRGCRLASTGFQELRERPDVEDVARKRKHPWRIIGELRKAEDGLLGSDKNTSVVDGHASLEIIQGDRKWVIWGRKCRGAGCEHLARIQLEDLGARTYRCK